MKRKSYIALIATIVMSMIIGTCSATSELTAAEFVLGKDNAFVELYGGIPKYSESYQMCIEDMVLMLAEAFNSSRLGTHTAQATIKGLVPYEVYKDKITNNEKMQAIYEYFVFDKLVNYFTLSFDKQGNPWKCELLKAGVKAYVEDGIACGVFTGSWKYFELDSSIGTFDEFCAKMNVTKELATALFFVLQSYDINWVEGSTSVFLDELVNNQLVLEPRYQNGIELKAKEEYEKAIDEFKSLDGYKDSVAQIKACERAIRGIKNISIEVSVKDNYASLRNPDGSAIVRMNKGTKFTITGYDPSCEMFTATYGERDGYVKGTGLSISKNELLEACQ